MSDIVNAAVEILSGKLADADIGGTVKFAIEGEGSIIADDSGVRAADEAADVTLSADADTFEGILAGDVNPTSAFMGGKLAVDGDMGLAMKLGTLLS